MGFYFVSIEFDEKSTMVLPTIGDPSFQVGLVRLTQVDMRQDASPHHFFARFSLQDSSKLSHPFECASNAHCISALGGTLFYLPLAVGQVDSGSLISVLEVRRVADDEVASMTVVVSPFYFEWKTLDILFQIRFRI